MVPHPIRRGRVCSMRGLIGSLIFAVLVGEVGLLLPAPARAALVEVVGKDGSAVRVARRRRRKKKKHRRGKKRRRGRKKAASPVEQGVVAILPFEGDGGGQAMASQVLSGIKSMRAGDGYQLEIALAPGSGRFAPASVRAALDAAGTQVLVRGVGQRQGDQVRVKIFAFAADGKLRFAKVYQSPAGERDPLALAATIGAELDAILPGLATLPEVTGAEAEELVASAPPPAAASPAPPADSASASPPAQKSQQAQAPSPQDTEHKERSEPLLSVGGGMEILYWSYELKSSALVDTVNWTPLDPYLGAALSLSLWPIEWLGLDLQMVAGMRSYGGELPVDQASIDLTALAVEGALRGRYLLEPGIGLGGHLGYRFDATFASDQTPVIIAPGYAAHLLSPGVDLYVTALAPLLWLRWSADLVPWGLYSESPDQPGQSAGLWGWRSELVLRSTFALGIYAELRAFYELNYVTYSGQGGRTNFDGAPLSDAEITNGLRGVSLGLGWSY